MGTTLYSSLSISNIEVYTTSICQFVDDIGSVAGAIDYKLTIHFVGQLQFLGDICLSNLFLVSLDWRLLESISFRLVCRLYTIQWHNHDILCLSHSHWMVLSTGVHQLSL